MHSLFGPTAWLRLLILGRLATVAARARWVALWGRIVVVVVVAAAIRRILRSVIARIVGRGRTTTRRPLINRMVFVRLDVVFIFGVRVLQLGDGTVLGRGRACFHVAAVLISPVLVCSDGIVVVWDGSLGRWLLIATAGACCNILNGTGVVVLQWKWPCLQTLL